MATQKNRGHHPDTRRDFETGTVNPGPGMAPPVDGKNQPTGNQSGPAAEQKTRKRQATQPKQSSDGQCGSCGCG